VTPAASNHQGTNHGEVERPGAERTPAATESR
jgi:hypothetical protein